jgi:predicted nuclease with TOPRIM domain
MTATTTQMEKENLEVHVDLCQLRYEQLQHRLSNVEEKLELLGEKLDKMSRSQMTATLTATATVIAACLSTVIVILTKV